MGFLKKSVWGSALQAELAQGAVGVGMSFLQSRHDAHWIECPERWKKSDSEPGRGLSSRAGAWCAAEVRSHTRSQAGATRSMWARLPSTGHLLCVCCVLYVTL